MLSKINFLSRGDYLFSPELSNALLNKKLPNQSIPGPYLIFIKSLNIRNNLFIIIFVIMIYLHPLC